MTVEETMRQLHHLANPNVIKIKKERFGINPKNSLGIYQKELDFIAKEIGKDDVLGLALFETGIYEAKLLCAKIYTPKNLTEDMMDDLAKGFDSWEICDSFCMKLFIKNMWALHKTIEWSKSEVLYIKRAAFVLMAALVTSDKKVQNSIFKAFIPTILKECEDERIHIKKAISWALRAMGKRNCDLHKIAVKAAYEMLKKESSSAQWIGKDVLGALEKPDLKFYDYPRDKYRA